MNIFADKCVNKLTVGLLRSWGHDVFTAQEAGLAGKPDEEILAFATQHERVLFTIDMDSAISSNNEEMLTDKHR